MEIHSIGDEDIYRIMCGKTKNTVYIINYLKSKRIEAEFAVIEENYVDRDFCVDYSKYYSSSHTKVRRVCRRIHFFRRPRSDDLRELFESSKGTATLQELYCGFTIIDGLYEDKNNHLIGHVGRTALRTYCGNENECEKRDGKRSFFHAHKQKVTLFGHELMINSLPFTSKDEDVGMCATAALWVAQFPLAERHGGERLSQYEITDIASRIDLGRSGRRFPAGLDDKQMLGYLYERGHEVECLYVTDETAELVCGAIKTFVDAKIPIIASLSLRKKEKCARKKCTGVDYSEYETDHRCPDYATVREGEELDGHAVIISGYSLNDEGELDGVYVHDDNIGPYARVKFGDEDVKNWEYKEGEYEDHCLVSLDALTIPIYPKIKLPYLSALEECKRIQRKSPKKAPYEVILTEGKDYKKEILRGNYELIDARSIASGDNEKIPSSQRVITQKVLEMLLPRFVWVVRGSFGGYEIDILLDSTSIERRHISTHYLIKKQT